MDRISAFAPVHRDVILNVLRRFQRAKDRLTVLPLGCAHGAYGSRQRLLKPGSFRAGNVWLHVSKSDREPGVKTPGVFLGFSNLIRVR
jgi:hypothetical protein